MSVTVVLGTQWGDEGKGKAIDYLARGYDFVARFNGGNNAGHTVINPLGEFKIHLVPSGIFHPHTRCLIGGGVVIDPEVLIREISSLKSAGVRMRDRLFISPRSHLILPYHKILDGLYESAKGAGATGTTRRGIGPAFADKVSYNGIRWGDLAEPSVFAEKLKVQIRIKNKIIRALGGKAINFGSVYRQYTGHYKKIRPYIRELFPLIQDSLRHGKKFLLEQAMGTSLDTDWGTYPFVTGSTTLASAATAGLGIPPRDLTSIVGVAKAYTTRVGAGPLPSEIKDKKQEKAKQILTEIAVTTGRTRRAGWLDLEAVRFSCQLNGVTELFLTKIDVLSAFDSIPLCVGYRFKGSRVGFADLDTRQLGQVWPVYETQPGWRTEIAGATRMSELPKAARNYVDRIERYVGVPVKWISTGPERNAVIERR